MHNKITIGFVVQRFETLGGKHICVSQSFEAGEVCYENADGEPVEIDTEQEQYQPFEMVAPHTACADGGLIFTCPECKGHRLECCEDGCYNSEVLNIDAEGDFDFGEINASGCVDRFQCLGCGFVPTDIMNNSFTEHTELAEWIKKNCEQPKK